MNSNIKRPQKKHPASAHIIHVRLEKVLFHLDDSAETIEHEGGNSQLML